MRTVTRLAGYVVCTCFASAAFAQSTAFTYQGKLTSNAQPAEGNHDFQYRLYDAATGGTQIGTTQCIDNLLVSSGVFASTIDFGNQFITAGQRFLEIEVRSDTGLGCANVTGFVTLTPRQPVTPTPTATHAKTAFALAAADGSPAQAVVVDNAGNVGIGTAAPTHNLHIATVGPTLALQDTDSSGGAGGQQVGYVSYRDSGNIERAWVGYGSAGDSDFSIVNARPGGDVVLNPFSGNVGIGTASPTSKLQVNGDIRLGASGQLHAAAGEENLRIIRGRVEANGTITHGSGFTVQTELFSGIYKIKFNTPFANIPVVTATGGPAFVFPVFCTIDQLANDAITISTRDLDGSHDSTPMIFHFIAVGPR